MSEAAWTCPGCGQVVVNAFCGTCGEHRIRARDLTVVGLVEQVVQAIVRIDGRLLRSIRSLLTRPGGLTTAYLAGLRRPYLAPLQLFLVANVVFFATESVTTATTLEGYAPVFDRAVALNAQSLVGVMVLPFALLPALLFRRSGRPFVGHVVFSLHFYAFVLLLLSAATAMAAGDVVLGGTGLASVRRDHGVSLVLLALCATYLYQASGAVYGTHGVVRVLQAGTLAGAAASIVLGYRFLLFVVTVYTT